MRPEDALGGVRWGRAGKGSMVMLAALTILRLGRILERSSGRILSDRSQG